MKGRLALLLLLPAMLLAGSALAAPRVVAAPRVAVLTFGPGDHAFSKFGHDAILIDDGQRELVYNFGTFRFDSPWLIADFLKGRLQYWLSVGTLDGTIAAYRAQNRSILLQELRMPAARRHALSRALAENALPQNRYYAYDYFRDNCATRVRDALDRAAGGAIRAASNGPGRLTYRQHALRLVADDWPLYVGLHLGLGAPSDRPTLRWDEAFLPEELAAILRTTPLVSAEQILFAADRPPPRHTPPNRVPVALGIGVLLGATAVMAASRSRRVLGVLLALWGTLLGLLGCALSFLWLATDHVAAHRNENLALLPPWALGLAVAGVALARGKAWADKTARILTAVALSGAVLLLPCKLLPWFGQDNAFFIALLLPLWAGLTLGTWLPSIRRLRHRR